MVEASAIYRRTRGRGGRVHAGRWWRQRSGRCRCASSLVRFGVRVRPRFTVRVRYGRVRSSYRACPRIRWGVVVPRRWWVGLRAVRVRHITRRVGVAAVKRDIVVRVGIPIFTRVFVVRDRARAMDALMRGVSWRFGRAGVAIHITWHTEGVLSSLRRNR